MGRGDGGSWGAKTVGEVSQTTSDRRSALARGGKARWTKAPGMWGHSVNESGGGALAWPVLACEEMGHANSAHWLDGKFKWSLKFPEKGWGFSKILNLSNGIQKLWNYLWRLITLYSLLYNFSRIVCVIYFSQKLFQAPTYISFQYLFYAKVQKHAQNISPTQTCSKLFLHLFLLYFPKLGIFGMLQYVLRFRALENPTIILKLEKKFLKILSLIQKKEKTYATYFSGAKL